MLRRGVALVSTGPGPQLEALHVLEPSEQSFAGRLGGGQEAARRGPFGVTRVVQRGIHIRSGIFICVLRAMDCAKTASYKLERDVRQRQIEQALHLIGIRGIDLHVRKHHQQVLHQLQAHERATAMISWRI